MSTVTREAGPYCIVGDDSGHDYVIPVKRRDEWDKWVHSPAWEEGDVPEWADRMEGYFEILDYTMDFRR